MPYLAKCCSTLHKQFSEFLSRLSSPAERKLGHVVLPSMVQVPLKAMLHEAILVATCNATMTNNKPFKLQRGVTRLQLFSQLATRTITNKMADVWHLAKDEHWLAHSEKFALQVAEGMLHARNLSRNVAKSRGSFYFSCNLQRNNCSCNMGCYTPIFSFNLLRNVCCVASWKKNCFV